MINPEKEEIFFGFALEQREAAATVASWITGGDCDFERYPWTSSDFSKDNDELFQTLINVAKNDVCAAVFIIGNDIKGGDGKFYPSPNVLIEYGLFVGVLGKEKVKICKIDNPEIPSDIKSILHADLNSSAAAETKMIKWVKYLNNKRNNVRLSKKELIILMHLMERKSTHGYATDSYIKGYSFNKGFDDSDVDFMLDKFIGEGLIIKERIQQEYVFFITKKGILEAKKERHLSIKEIKVCDGELEV